MTHMSRWLPTAMLAVFTCWSWGCAKPLHFPTDSMPAPARSAGASAAYDTDGDARADFFTFADPNGRINRIGYDSTANGACKQILDLDAIPPTHCRHLVIILDGFGYDVVKRYYDAGGLRMFHPPSRVVAPYPTLTDLCIEDILGYIPCRGFEAEYFDTRKNKLAGGAWDYVTGKNQPYNRLLAYRANLIWDAVSYVAPWEVFGKELNDIVRFFNRAEGRETLAYLVSSAGVSTKYGASGQQRALKQVERLILQVLWQTRGLTEVTLLADHGHSYVQSTRIPLEEHLRGRAWRLSESLRGDRDVVSTRFGLETYAGFSTRHPAELAADLAACTGVDLVSYADQDTVVVLSADGGQAIIHRHPGRCAYKTLRGDPLKLAAILSSLQADADGFYDDDRFSRPRRRTPTPPRWSGSGGRTSHRPRTSPTSSSRWRTASITVPGTSPERSRWPPHTAD